MSRAAWALVLAGCSAAGGEGASGSSAPSAASSSAQSQPTAAVDDESVRRDEMVAKYPGLGARRSSFADLVMAYESNPRAVDASKGKPAYITEAVSRIGTSDDGQPYVEIEHKADRAGTRWLLRLYLELSSPTAKAEAIATKPGQVVQVFCERFEGKQDAAFVASRCLYIDRPRAAPLAPGSAVRN